jgi:oxygen-independent coproporphyrinogen-3 oxidase
MDAKTPARGREGKLGLFKAALNEKPPQAFRAREGVDPLTHAFEKKMAVHAGLAGQPVPAAQRARVLREQLAKPRRNRSAVYIHVPFCESRCLYCGFYNRAYRRGDGRRFADGLLREIDLWGSQPAMQKNPVQAVYLGGGTPTALEAVDLRRLLAAVTQAVPLANDCEITVEGRIHNFGGAKMAACLEGGANRFSIGVQSFHTELRQSMARRADRETILRALSRLRDDGRAVVVIDLMYGLPGQTMAMWRRDIEDFLALEIDGADFYQLNVFKTSPLAAAVAGGKLPPAAELPQQARMFAEGVEQMTRARYVRLSINHWGRTTRERNIYNQLMKGPAECLAFGPGAGGCLNGYAYFVESDFSRWLTAVEQGQKPISILVAPPTPADLGKTIAAAFDLGRLNLDRLRASLGEPVMQGLQPLLDQWQRIGLIQIDAGWLELTVAGQFWHVNLAQLLIDCVQERLSRKSS